MKKLFVTVLCVVIFAVSCGNGAGNGTGNTARAVSSEPVITEWAKQNKINDGSQTAAELYELAKAEGKVVVYSISSRISNIKQTFEKQYPGIIADVYDISTNELYEKITREIDAGVYNADIIHIKDEDGMIYTEMVMPGKFTLYYPGDIASHIPESSRRYSMPLYVELAQWFYNYELFDGPPVSSWWDLTRPEWKGRLVMQEPTQGKTYLINFTAFVANADLFERDYERVFGEKLVLSPGCPTAGHELIKRLFDNDIVFESSSDSVCIAVGTPGQKGPGMLGWGASSKLRKNESDGWVLAPINMTPGTSLHNQNNLYVVTNAAHPNAAKLFIRWMLGETDGKGPGFSPFNTLGGWSVRDDVIPAEGNPLLGDVLTLEADPAWLYQNVPEIQDFWTALQAGR
ncbi:MAG: ABC transporter substrate-binding protein [Spirochaetaceae bacterium]|jgi:iron(III) transport system substrate-binding protein|nr:ABC transporter substrate-binding protein [Spirochaetaceae bacterium]